KRRETVQRVATAIAERTEGSPFALAPAGSVNGLDAFLGATAENNASSDPGHRLTIGETLDKLQEVVGPANTSYLEPGAIVQTPGRPSLKAFVLGPPRDEAL